MKKMFLFLPAVLLALFISGCSDPVQEKVPESADQLLQLNGKSFVKTRTYQENKDEILKKLKEGSLPESILDSRIVICASLQDKWAGILIQTQNGDAVPLFQRITAEIKESVKDLKIEEDGKKFSGRTDRAEFFGVLESSDLMLIGVGKNDPAFFHADSPNPLFSLLKKDMIFSAAGKLSLPKDGPEKQYTDLAVQMVPALQKLKYYTFNIPVADDPEVDFRMVFDDDQAASEMLAAVNAGLGFIAQDNPQLNTALTRKAEKNTVIFSFKTDEMEKAVKAVRFKKKQKIAARQKAKKAKKAKAAKQQSAKPAAPAEAQKPAQPEPVKAAPAEAQKPAQPKAAEPAKPAAAK